MRPSSVTEAVEAFWGKMEGAYGTRADFRCLVILFWVYAPLPCAAEWQLVHTVSGFGGSVRQQIASNGEYTFIYNEGANTCSGTLARAEITRLGRLAIDVQRDPNPFVQSADGCLITDVSFYSLFLRSSDGATVSFPSYEQPGRCSYDIYPESVATITLELQRLSASKLKSECLRKMTSSKRLPEQPHEQPPTEQTPRQ